MNLTATGGDLDETSMASHGAEVAAGTDAYTVFRFALDGSGGSFIRFKRNYRDLAGIAFDDRESLYVAVANINRPYNLILQIRDVK